MLHPIAALESVCDEYRAYLQTEFRAKDPGLRDALERELDRPGFLTQEPFFQAHRPFKSGARWSELHLEPALAQALRERSGSEHAYLHQSGSIERLLGPEAGPLVVTTGTGSGKTECFLAPVIQNAFEDATHFKRDGLTALLIYPMNALANDQEERIGQFLKSTGWEGVVRVAKYDRQTSEEDRRRLRQKPPHILLTNYMMLEYLLIRPADRDSIFANHRCRFLVLDEVHTYRGALGTNIALLVRRAKAHLSQARQDWLPDPPPEQQSRRFPALICVGTSATIKSVDESGLPPEEVRRQRDEAVQGFFGRLAGEESTAVAVYGEELLEQQVPAEAVYGQRPLKSALEAVPSMESVRATLIELGGAPATTSLVDAARRARLLWDLNAWLVRRPMSVSGIVARARKEIPGRSEWSAEDVRREVEAALVAGASLPDGYPGALRLRAHRFFRGGWRFHRCLNPACGRLYPKGEERCECGFLTAPLYLCRNCGADYLGLTGNPQEGPLRPLGRRDPSKEPEAEWMLYLPDRFKVTVDDEDDCTEDEERCDKGRRSPKRMRGKPVLSGSFDASTLLFSADAQLLPVRVMLAPARTRCLCCGGTAGSRNVITPVALGTSAAVKVLAEGVVEALEEANRDRAGHDGKERLLVFSDSRQDAAHQARFIIYASRYDRMRRHLYRLLQQEGTLSIQRAVELLAALAIQERGSPNPHVPEEGSGWIPPEQRERIQAWEEAALLDDLAVTAGFRATVVNLGLVRVVYAELSEYLSAQGQPTAAALGISLAQLEYVCRCLLDEMRIRSAINRPLLRYHPSNASCPQHLREADWPRRIKSPLGYPVTPQGEPAAYLDAAEVPAGIGRRNAWRREGRGKAPGPERILRSLLSRLGGADPHEQHLLDVLSLLKRGGYVESSELFGFRDRCKLLQVNAERVILALADAGTRRRCSVCGKPCHGAPEGLPCASCHGKLEAWRDEEIEASRAVTRIRQAHVAPLVAAEHTAQVPGDTRKEFEEEFKASPETAARNLLVCSPTLEMGIDVGGLDAIILRNIPPRPDNYAQRGGRAGRRTRVGLVLGYARSTPHDQYFYEKPAEMIAGEVPAPPLNLANRDTILRHLHAIAFGAAEPGLAGKMVAYVNAMGEIQEENVAELIEGLKAQFGHAVDLAAVAWGADALAEASLSRDDMLQALDRLPERIRDVFARTARQVKELRRDVEAFAESLTNRRAAGRAGDMVAHLLGIETEDRRGKQDADDRSAGYPPRRFAEFGILPGYEFPSELAALRLRGDSREEEAVTTVRRFGIGQFQPDSLVFARGGRWKVAGLDMSSPWNPALDAGVWRYRICRGCGQRYDADDPQCPRCRKSEVGVVLCGREYGGFTALRDDASVLDEEDRMPPASLVLAWPQWDGEVRGRWQVAGAWSLRLARGEEVRWLNEGRVPTKAEHDQGCPLLHDEAIGHALCPTCGRLLTVPSPTSESSARRHARRGNRGPDEYGHAADCLDAGRPPEPAALVATGRSDTLRLLTPVPDDAHKEDVLRWGMSLGYSLKEGMRRLYVLDDSELEFILEEPWKAIVDGAEARLISLTFVDPALGGAGFLPRAADEFDRVAAAALEHLDHQDCETACYRCLKDYRNQRHHEHLQWPLAIGPLQAIAAESPTTQPLAAGDVNGPQEWLDAYAAGVGSPLELKFLRLFEQRGIDVEKQVRVSPTLDGKPISVADFVVRGKRVAIYVDGAAYHVGERLRRDRSIRDLLRGGDPPWCVVELRAGDLSDAERIIDRVSRPQG